MSKTDSRVLLGGGVEKLARSFTKRGEVRYLEPSQNLSLVGLQGASEGGA